MAWNADNTSTGVRNAGPDAGITSLRVQGDNVYGTTWHYGPGGNLEGTFKASVGSGDVEWVTDCHGDAYSAFLQNGVVYSVGHAHYCGNHGGGHPQYPAWRFQHTQAWTDTVGGEILNDVHGYPNWHFRRPGPSMINWLPEMAIGSFTGQYQAGWHVTGDNDYVVVGGEFPRVNGANQQGLVRFARRSLLSQSQRQQGPRFLNNEIVPTLIPTGPTAVRVSWLAGFDRDDLALQYEVYRTGVAAPRYTTSANSNWWTTPSLGFVDTGLAAGQTYTYSIVVRDSDNHVINGAPRNVTMPGSVPTNTYANRVRADGARLYWPLNEPVLPQPAQIIVRDRAGSATSAPGIGVSDGRSDTGVTWGHSGAIAGDSAARLTTTNEWSRIFSLGTETAPDTFTSQVWINTTTTSGGRILGFGDLQSGNSGHRDRHLYMDNAGRIWFGVRAQNNSTRTLNSPTAYNNGQWHQITATMGTNGMRLYVDGALVASRTDTTQGEAYLGYWRVGGDNMGGWPGGPSNVNFVNAFVDEVAVYGTVLTPAQVLAQWQARIGGPPPANQPPTASFTWSTSGLTVNVNGSASSDPDGTISSYSWNWGDGSPNTTGATTSHPYAAAGSYTVTLTVTDNQGATGTLAQTVTVSTSPQVATDSFTRTTPSGFGTANVGGAWTVSNPASTSVDGSAGLMTMTPGNGPLVFLNSVSEVAVDATADVSSNQAGSGGGIYQSLAVRRIGTSDYRIKVRITAADVTLYLVRTINGAETTLVSQVVPGLVYQPGQVLHLRVRVTGTSPTTLQGRLWVGAQAEPSTWNLTTTDATAALQNPGAVGFHSYLSGSAAGGVTLRVDNLNVVRV